MELQNWLEANSLDGEIVSSTILKLDNKQFLILQSRFDDEVIIDDEFNFLLTPEDREIIIEHKIDDIVFLFGSKWYYSSIENPKLNVLKYIGKSLVSQQEINISYLGVHGKYDFCNGSRDYKEWCNKAKFLGITTLGLCEQDTLAGTLSFQMACKDAGIKSILGETVTVKDGDIQYKVKLYCINEVGWRNLLNINAQIKVFNEGFVDVNYILKDHYEGLICVIDCSTELNFEIIEKYTKCFINNLYYQFDPVEWAGSTKEEKHLDLMKSYIHHYYDSIIPVLICDSYYLDKDETHVRKMLNKIGKVGFQNESNDQWFKDINDIVVQCDELFKNEDKSGEFINKLITNTSELVDKCDFKIKIGELYLPSYELTNEQSINFASPKDLFWYLIQSGLENKIIGKVKDEQVYLDRIQEEVRVIEKGNIVDYFLILWDIISWCERNDILVSPGRGSSSGSLVAYLLGIVKIDPIEYKLLFERFLSESRIGKSLPDIDTDIDSSRRDDVKRYMEQRYGIDHVTSIGTYGTFQIKGAIKDLGKYFNVDYAKTNYITSFLPADCSYTDLFKLAQEYSRQNKPELKKFLQKNFKVIENYPLVIDQPSSISIHAAGVVITPKSYNGKSMTIYDWIPVKKLDGVLVSEWEGEYLDAAGFLKADILGITQLEKFSKIISLIKQNHKKDISFLDMDLEQEGVFHLFQEGYNEDVFQFGTMGLKSYCKELKPENIEDLIAAVSLYRPGPMESGAHKSFVKLRHGKQEPEYDYMLEDVTKDTYGLYIYQEEVMKAAHVLGGISLADTDGVRKAMGKKDFKIMEKYKAQFIEGAIKNKCTELNAIAIWNKLEVFAGYGFNRSHAAAYAYVGLFCQWLKYNYPIEFWTVSLHYAKQEQISKRIAEINKISTVKVLPPDINNSIDVFKPDFETNTIYWSISSISHIGPATMDNLMKERNDSGNFFSFEEFYNRTKGKGINKKAILNLILSGCFDIIEKIKSPADRIYLVKKFILDINNDEMPEDLQDPSLLSKDYFWILKQKELTGFGYFDFDKIYKSNNLISKNSTYIDAAFLQTDEYLGKFGCVIGVLSEVNEKNGKVAGDYAQLVISANDENIPCIMWNNVWSIQRELMISSKNKIVMITGQVKEYYGMNQIQTNEKTKIQIL